MGPYLADVHPSLIHRWERTRPTGSSLSQSSRCPHNRHHPILPAAAAAAKTATGCRKSPTTRQRSGSLLQPFEAWHWSLALYSPPLGCSSAGASSLINPMMMMRAGVSLDQVRRAVGRRWAECVRAVGGLLLPVHGPCTRSAGGRPSTGCPRASRARWWVCGSGEGSGEGSATAFGGGSAGAAQ